MNEVPVELTWEERRLQEYRERRKKLYDILEQARQLAYSLTDVVDDRQLRWKYQAAAETLNALRLVEDLGEDHAGR